jgi:uncharacterized protein (DUF2252 family)
MALTLNDDNDAYEAWLRTQCDVVQADLDCKHERMKTNAFIFLRATFFRWAKTIPALLPELDQAPKVLSVGDAHVENFGTWSDPNGDEVWGVNDFDDRPAAYPAIIARETSAAVDVVSGTNMALVARRTRSNV